MPSSGSTGKAAKLEGFGFIGVEREEEYAAIARARIAAACAEPNLFETVDKPLDTSADGAKM